MSKVSSKRLLKTALKTSLNESVKRTKQQLVGEVLGRQMVANKKSKVLVHDKKQGGNHECLKAIKQSNNFVTANSHTIGNVFIHENCANTQLY